MNLLEKVAHKALNKVFPRRDVWVEGDLYLRRWYLHFGLNKRVFLHYIAKSDDVRSLHDHPWDFSTFILARGYREHLPEGQSRRVLPFTKLRHKAEHVHAVSPEWGPAWTVVVVKPARRVWGFHTKEGWKDWRTYLGQPNAPDWPEDLVTAQPTLGSDTGGEKVPVPVPARKPDARPWRPPAGHTKCQECGFWSPKEEVYCPYCAEK